MPGARTFTDDYIASHYLCFVKKPVTHIGFGTVQAFSGSLQCMVGITKLLYLRSPMNTTTSSTAEGSDSDDERIRRLI